MTATGLRTVTGGDVKKGGNRMANTAFEKAGGRKRKKGELGCKQCVYSELVIGPGSNPQKTFGCKVPGKGEYIYCEESDVCDYFNPIPSVK